jgi:glutathione S-transferase
VRALVDLVDQACSRGRALVTRRMLASPAALDDALVGAPRVLRPLARPITRYGTGWFARKYALDLDDGAVAGHRAAIAGALDVLRERLRGGRYVLGRLTYADLAFATLLQGVRPVDHPRWPLPPATREAWTDAELPGRYADLLEWRDGLYRDHR